MKRIAIAALVLACGGSGGSVGSGRARSAAHRVHAEPVEAKVSARRVGAAVRLDIQGIGRGAREGAAFEDPAHWRISARQGGRALDRLVNGSVAIERAPAGQVQWYTVVRFSVAYEVVSSQPIRLEIDPPGGPMVQRTIRP